MITTDQDQRLPGGFSEEGDLQSIQETLSDLRSGRTRPGGTHLSQDQRRAVAVERIQAKRDYAFVHLDGSRITADRALGEIRRSTKLGASIVELEFREIRLVQEALLKQGG